MTLEQIAESAMRLPSGDRAKLADQLVNSLDESAYNEIDRMWGEVAIRRRDEVRDGKVKTIPGPDALRSVRESFSRR